MVTQDSLENQVIAVLVASLVILEIQASQALAVTAEIQVFLASLASLAFQEFQVIADQAYLVTLDGLVNLAIVDLAESQDLAVSQVNLVIQDSLGLVDLAEILASLVIQDSLESAVTADQV